MLLQLIISVLIISGIHVAFKEGNVFGGISFFAESHGFPEWLSKPLWLCPWCMASFHGTIIWLKLNVPHECFNVPGILICLYENTSNYLGFILALAGLSYITWTIIDYLIMKQIINGLQNDIDK